MLKNFQKTINIIIIFILFSFIPLSAKEQNIEQHITEEKMLIEFKKLKYLLEHVSQYYTTSLMNLDKMGNILKLKKTIKKIDEVLKIIKLYSYPQKIKKEEENIINSWKTHKKLLISSESIPLPNLLSISIKNFKNNINKLELYHKKIMKKA